MNANSRILRLFLLLILLAGVVTAQTIPDIQVRIEGPDEVAIGSPAVFRAVVEADEAGAPIAREAALEWIFDGKVVASGPVFEYRAARVGAWQIKVRLVRGDRSASVLASSSRTLMATRAAEPAARSAPAVSVTPQIVAPVAAPSGAPGGAWVLEDTKEVVKRSRATDSKNRISISGTSCVAAHEMPCAGNAAILLRWTEPPARLAPGDTLRMDLTEELDLALDTNCAPAKPFEVELKATWLVRKGAQASQAAISLVGAAKQPFEKFRKAKMIEWPAPSGALNDKLIVEIKVESPAGTASKFYTYIFKNAGETASASVPAPGAKAGPLSVDLTKESPKGNRVLAGEPAVFRASLLSGSARADNAFVLKWKSEPPAMFKLDGASASVVFTKPGPARVWCEAYRGADTAKPAAVSARSSLDVVAAQIEITIEPPAAKVGDEIKASVQAINVFKGAEMHWLPLPSNVRLLGRSKDGRVIQFYMTDSKPAQLQIQARQPGGAVLGGAAATVQAQSYEVSIAGPVPGSPAPQLWVPGSGLVKVTDRLAVDQNLSFTASVKGMAEDAALTFLWSAKEEACSVRTPVSRKAEVVCSETGRFTIAVTVRDERGVELGRAAGGFDVTISQEQLRAAWNCAKADQLEKEAAALAAQGRQEEAAAKYREGLSLWPDDSVQRRLKDVEVALAADKEQKKRFSELLRTGHELERQGDYGGAVKKYRESLAIQPDKRLENHITQLESEAARRDADRAQAAVLRAQAAEFIRAGRLKDAADNLKQSLLFEADEQVQQQISKLEAQIAEQDAKKARAAQLIRDGEALEREGDLDGALAKLKESLSEWPDESLRTSVQVLEQSVSVQKSLSGKAVGLKEEGAALEQAGDLEGAVAKYRESLALRADETLKGHAEQLAQTVEQNQKLSAEAAAYRDEGLTHETQGNLDKALASYRKSVEKAPDAALEQRVRDLETKIAERDVRKTKARELVDQATKLEQEGNLRDAIEAGRKSLDYVSDPLVRSRMAALETKLAEQEARQARAAELALNAQALKEQGELAGAVAKYRESLTAWPNEELEKLVRELEEELQAENAFRAKVKELVAKAEALELEGKADEAIAAYRESLELQANGEIQNRIEVLQKQMVDRKASEERAAALKAQAELLEQDGQIAEAVVLFRQSEELVADEALVKRADDLEKRLAEEETKKMQAAKLAKEAFDLEREGRTEEALAKHKESLALWPDGELEKRAAILEEILSADAAKKAEAAALQKAGADLEQAGHIEAASAKYRMSLDLVANAELLKHVQEIDAKIIAEQERLARARSLMEEGRLLELEGNLKDATEKYRASLAIQADSELQARLTALENEAAQREAAVAEAQRLKQQAAEMAMGGRVMDAIRGYKRSLELVPDPATEKQVQALELSLAQQEARRAQAAKLSKEAYDLERQGQVVQALAKHRESLAQWPDAELEKRVQMLESMLAADAARKTRAAELKRAGAVLEQQGNLEAAVAKYRTSLEDVPDAELDKKVAALDRAIAQQTANRAAARRLQQDAAKLEEHGLLAEAVATLKESLKLQSDSKIQAKVTSLEERMADEQARIKQARTFVAEAFKKEKAGDFEGAIVLFRKGLDLVEDDSIERHLATLEAALAVETAKKDQAQRLKEEGYAFEERGAREQAIQKYRESLDLWPDKDLAVRLSLLQESMSLQVRSAADAGRLREQARSQEQKGDLQGAIGKYEESLKVVRDPAVEQHVATLRKQVEQREKNRGRADEFWKEGLSLLSERKTAEAAISMRMSLQYFYMEDRARYLKQVESQQVAAAPRVGAPAGPAVPLAGTSWTGVMLIRGRSGTMQWPVRFKVRGDNTVNADYEIQDITSSKLVKLHLEGSYLPSTRRFNLQFQQSEQGRVSVRGTLSGEALTAASGGGDARLSSAAAGSTVGTGVWRITRE